jgi:hypothetical protein
MPVELFRILVTATVLCLALYAIFTAFSVFTCQPYKRYRRFKDCLFEGDGQGMGLRLPGFSASHSVLYGSVLEFIIYYSDE